MPSGLDIPKTGALDFLALGALVHRLDPGIVPFRKASACTIYVSGGEFNCAANLSDAFRMRTAVATAMVEYPIGDLIAGQVRAMGVQPYYKMFVHDGVRGPNMAAVYSDRGFGVRGPIVYYNRSNEAASLLKRGDFDWAGLFGAGVSWVYIALETFGSDRGGDGVRAGARRDRFVRFELSRKALAGGRRRQSRPRCPHAHRRARRRPCRERRGPAEGTWDAGSAGRRRLEARSECVRWHDRTRDRSISEDEGRRHDTT